MDWVGDGKERWAVAVSAVRLTADLDDTGSTVTTRVEVRVFPVLVRADNEWEATSEAEDHVRLQEIYHEPGWSLRSEARQILL